MLEDLLRPFNPAIGFRGRARRCEYWLFILLSWLVIGAIGGIGLALGWHPYDAQGDLRLFQLATAVDKITGAALAIAALLLFVPWLAVQVRRLHDTNRSARMLVWNLVPYIGALILVVILLLPGTEGPNRYGADPTEEVDEWGRVIAKVRSASRDPWGRQIR